jgi:hypothetical protein
VSTKFDENADPNLESVWGDDYCVSADEIALIEDLQEIEYVFSRKTAENSPAILLDSESLNFWGLDLSRQLNDGDVTVENVVNKFRVSVKDPDHLAFGPVGMYELCLERDSTGEQKWLPHIKMLEAAVG